MVILALADATLVISLTVTSLGIMTPINSLLLSKALQMSRLMTHHLVHGYKQCVDSCLRT